ncbi:hypothetical protein SASPL_106206 [Salvia splendens]|uniref:Vacuolar protein sorting-associated protein 62 n=1 Tax=Salvia splendens TaxID=180675 RepID=A0A8X8YS07_SALSN|nr:uncharacterized protein LOC121792670 [Salvia splendens]KAG6434568.1 hypothetical protein SASPL_106206 [Salvia splendens]
MRRKQRRTSHEEEFPNNQRFISQFTLSQFHFFTKIVRTLNVVFGAILNWCRLLKMLGCKCLSWTNVTDLTQPKPEFFSLPEPLPQWPQGCGFATSRIELGGLEVCQITNFEFIWCSNPSTDGKQSISFYKPILIPDGFYCLGHYCQPDKKPLRGFVLVAREAAGRHDHSTDHMPSLVDPVDYSLVWSSYDGGDENFDGCGYFWLPQPPEGYKSLGFVVTNKSKKPETNEVKCVRADLTDTCEACPLIACTYSKFLKVPLTVWNARPLNRGIYGRGVSTGTFYCRALCSNCSLGEELDIACLKNLDPNLHAMPNMDQIHAIVEHYGPTVFFHPNEVYLPSSVSWFFQNGALLYSTGESMQAIDAEGSVLPYGGSDDGHYWIDLPCDGRREKLKHGNIESAILYLHVKPAFGGTFTDIVMWVFCPFNGPGTLKIGKMSIGLSKVGRHVGDWEHFTLRISNFTGELWSIYFSQHSGGEWVDAYDLEFNEGNKAIIYSSRNGHASYPYPGTYIQGNPKLRIGARNDAARSDYFIDSSRQYEVVAAEYLGDVVKEPCWLQYMRKWGPRIVYDSKSELDKIVKRLPPLFRNSMNNILSKLPLELYGEDGPTGPKEKNNWFGDERW